MFEDEEWERPTSSYNMGTCVIYRSPKRPKNITPAYGYKFVQTEKAMKTKSKSRKGKKGC